MVGFTKPAIGDIVSAGSELGVLVFRNGRVPGIFPAHCDLTIAGRDRKPGGSIGLLRACRFNVDVGFSSIALIVDRADPEVILLAVLQTVQRKVSRGGIAIRYCRIRPRILPVLVPGNI